MTDQAREPEASTGHRNGSVPVVESGGQHGPGAGQTSENTETMVAPPPRYVDPTTLRLAYLSRVFEDAQRVRKASELRQAKFFGTKTPWGDDVKPADLFKRDEEMISKQLGKALREHVLWDWLEPLKGLSGPLTARALGLIGDPRRFPGQLCTAGHTLPSIYDVGAPCPVVSESPTESDELHGDDVTPDSPSESERASGDDLGDTDLELGHESELRSEVQDNPGGNLDYLPESEDRTEIVPCEGTMRTPRQGSGVRALYHYAGLHVVNGELPRRRKGVQADWNPRLRTLALQPNGLADMILRHRRDNDGYCLTCSPRWSRTRGKYRVPTQCGTLFYGDIYDAAKARGKFHNVARTIAVKNYLKYLLLEWKGRYPA